MVPDFSAMTAASFGRRASNSSATRGRPPVMSRVLADSIGIRATMSPAWILEPGSTAMIEFDRQLVAGLAAPGELHRLALGVVDRDVRTQVAGARVGAPVRHHALGDAGRLVGRLRHRGALDEVLVGDRAFRLGHDRTGIGVPLGDALAALHLVALVHLEPRAVLHAVHGTLRPVGTDDHNGHVAGHRDQVAVGVRGPCCGCGSGPCPRSSIR